MHIDVCAGHIERKIVNYLASARYRGWRIVETTRPERR